MISASDLGSASAEAELLVACAALALAFKMEKKRISSVDNVPI